MTLGEEKVVLVDEVLRNGISIMHRIATMEPDPVRGRNTSAWDCEIGSKTTKLALDLFKDEVPKSVLNHMLAHQRQENCHCAAKLGMEMPKELAKRISKFHADVTRNHGILSYLACMPLGGERAALAQALYHPSKSDPHCTLQGSLSEVFHQTLAFWDLIVLAESHPVEELQDALEDQKKLMEMLGVIAEDRRLIGADGEICGLVGWEPHMV